MSVTFLKEFKFHILIVFALIIAGVVITQGNAFRPKSTSVPVAVSLNQEELRSERELITSELEAYGAQQAYELFKERHADKDRVVQHDLAHIFGEALYKEVGNPGVAICDASFSYGCYHSFFGYALMENGIEIVYDLEAACVDAYGPKGLGCQHGIGHGVLAELGYDDLQEALDVCRWLEWQGPIGGCTSGVIMEYNFATMQNGPTRTLRDDNRYSPCEDISENFHEACYFEIPQWWFAWHNMEALNSDGELSFSKPGEYCSAVEGTINRSACFRGLGNTIAGRLTYSIDEIKNHCSLDSSQHTSWCLQGAAWLLSWEPTYNDTWEELCSNEVGESLQICLASKDLI